MEKFGGYHKPANGTFRVLVVLAKLKNDSYDPSNDNWPAETGGLPPQNMLTLFNTKGALNNFFDVMSFGRYNLEPVLHDRVFESDYELSHYLNIPGQEAGLKALNREILLKASEEINFEDYDNFNGHNPGSDGRVDMIYLIYRYLPQNLVNYSAIAILPLESDLIVGNMIITRDFGYNGSGIMIARGINSLEHNLFTSAHELGHYLLGGDHIDKAFQLVLMSSSFRYGPFNVNRGMHTIERHYLGWLPTLSTTISTLEEHPLSDYMTTGDHLTFGDYDTLYVMEFRNNESSFDGAVDRGLYIYEITNGIMYPPKINVQTAEGEYNFSAILGNDLNSTKIERLSPNRYNGFSEFSYRVYNYAPLVDGDINCVTPFYSGNDAYGDTLDAWDPYYNNVYSIYSNPRPKLSKLQKHTFAVVVGRITSDKLYMDFLVGADTLKCPPVKPYNLRIRKSSSNHPEIQWEIVQMLGGSLFLKHLIYKKNTIQGEYFLIDSVSGPQNYYIDETELLHCNDCSNQYQVSYKIKAVQHLPNNQPRKESVFSDAVSVLVEGTMPDAQVKSSSAKEKEPSFLSVYPNPFNPSTNVSYKFKSDSYCKIVLYNMLGEEIKLVFDGIVAAGTHNISLNLSELPSGNYLLSLKEGNNLHLVKLNYLK
jgi:hypothetical protein